MHNIHTLHDRFCQYSLTFKGNSRSTIRWFKEGIKYYLRYAHIEHVEEVSRQNVETWILTCKQERNWAPQTIRGYLRTISLFLDWCVREKLIPENFVRQIPKPRLPKTIPQHLSKEQATSLIEWTKNFRYDYKFERTRATAIIATFIYTGIRLQELKNLRLHSVDLQQGILCVVAGKGSKDRIVPLHPQLVEILREYLKDRDRLKKCSPYFFVALRSDDRMGDLVITRLIQRIREKSGIYFYPHLLRHTFATLMLEGGCDLFTLSKMLGHSDIKTTTIYLSATTAHMQEQIIKHPLSF